MTEQRENGEVPPLLAEVEVANLPGFDVMPSPGPKDTVAVPRPPLSPKLPPPSSRPGARPVDPASRRSEVVLPPLDSPFQAPGFRLAHPHSVSLPASPSGFGPAEAVLPVALAPGNPNDLRRQAMMTSATQQLGSSPPLDMGRKGGSVRFEPQGKVVFRSQPMPGGQPGSGRAMSRDRRYDSFKTFSGKLERQLTQLTGAAVEAPAEGDDGGDAITSSRAKSLPKVDRFFAALEGPELDKLKSSEDLVLPSDKTWPFLLRFPVSAFGIVLGVSSQAILWKNIATSAPTTTFLHVSSKVNLFLWWASVALMCVIAATYALKVVFFFEAVRREYYHPIRANFFFAPWIACLFLAIGVPESVAATLPSWLWYLLMAPILCLELKIYGQWISGGQRRLSRVANPSNHLAIVGNFVGALLGGIMGLKEGPLFFFAVGLAHYVVLFVTLYQRLPTSETLPRDLHPVFFLFVATPSVACLAWARITGEFDYGSRIAYFIAMFLYASLAVRINLFRGFHFSLAWWAYTFPMTSAAIASIRYSSEVNKNVFTQSLCIGLSVAATLTVTALFVTTLFHALVLRDLFPNDISIAITERRFKQPTTATEMMMMMVPPEHGSGRSKVLAPAAPSDASRDLEAAVATSYT